MKRKFTKILGVGLILALLASVLIMAAPVAAEEPAIRLTAIGEPGETDTIVVEVPSGTALGDIESIAWEALLVSGYAVHVDIIIEVGEETDALVVEYAYNTETHYAEGQITGDAAYGCFTGAWYATFSDDTFGPAVITGTSNAWLTSQTSGPLSVAVELPNSYGSLDPGFYYATLADWADGSYMTGIGADTPVTHLEIEIDNWIMDTEALVSNIVVAITGADEDVVEMTASSPGEIIGISVDPTSVDFGSLIPGSVSDPMIVTVTNTGNIDENFSASLTNISVPDIYTTGLVMEVYNVSGILMSVGSVSEWTSFDGVTPDGSRSPGMVLEMPSGTPAGTYTATLIFWAEATP